MTRAFSFNQDTPNKIRKTISSVFRSPFQSSSSSHYSHHHQYQQTLGKRSLTVKKRWYERYFDFVCYFEGQQTSSKLASLASLQLTPTLSETKRKFMHTLKSSSSRAASIAVSESTSTLNGMSSNQLLRQQTCSSINNHHHQTFSNMMSNQMTTSSLLSLDACINENKIMPPPPPMQQAFAVRENSEQKPIVGAKVFLSFHSNWQVKNLY